MSIITPHGRTGRRDLLRLGAAGLVAAGTLPGRVARAQDFAGKTIEWIIPLQVGGGSDTWARFHLPFLSRHLPGHPTIVIRNITGGGGINGTNQFAARARPDGLTILGTTGSVQFPYLLGDPRVRYDYKAWAPVLAGPTGGVLYIRPELGVRSVADFAKLKAAQGLKYGSQGPTSLDIVPALAFEILGLDVQIVFGMQGRGPGRLAFERGETPIDYQTTSAFNAQVMPLVREGKAVPLFSWGALNAQGELVRDPNFPDLPHFAEFATAALGAPPSGPAWEAWRTLFVAGFAAQKFVVLPKETPAAILDTYRAAFARTLADPEYKEKRAAVIGEYDEVTGEACNRAYAAATNMSDTTRAWVRDWLLRRFNHRM
ncbi:MAG: tricarboxylate transporter [Acetobacteraceae bacterium]|nr:tricarboxylate transporter [Acetobacteraceae bacterium]